ncbi:unnamed protein product [Spirodela intermedia]|uniref:Uncharacterized protein n=1 Tax=Spirodela intermedia TaxID=51605 RepID=A0A7I8KRC4_SPIIN|nr:unnamed protein product [Spirodela intermedia]
MGDFMLPMQILTSGPRLDRIREETLARYRRQTAALDGRQGGDVAKQVKLQEQSERMAPAEGAQGKEKPKATTKKPRSSPCFAPEFDGINFFETIISA